MDANTRVIWLNRALNAIAALGFTVSGLAAAVAEIGGLAEQATKLGVVPARWMGWAALVGAIGHVAAKWSKTPSQAIAAAVPPANAPPAPPPAAILLLVGLALGLLHGCGAPPEDLVGTEQPFICLAHGGYMNQQCVIWQPDLPVPYPRTPATPPAIRCPSGASLPDPGTIRIYTADSYNQFCAQLAPGIWDNLGDWYANNPSGVFTSVHALKMSTSGIGHVYLYLHPGGVTLTTTLLPPPQGSNVQSGIAGQVGSIWVLSP